MIDFLMAAVPAVGGFFLGAFFIRVTMYDKLSDEHTLLVQRIKALRDAASRQGSRNAARSCAWLLDDSPKPYNAKEFAECFRSENP